jgi:hypothetical protein
VNIQGSKKLEPFDLEYINKINNDMKKIVRENINEADNAEHNLKNYDAYKEAVAMFPVIKEILEDILGTTPQYRIVHMNQDHNRMTFWFSKYGSMQLSCRSQADLETLFNHKVTIQYPGNQDYGFSISMFLGE